MKLLETANENSLIRTKHSWSGRINSNNNNNNSDTNNSYVALSGN